jgi:uncharacterized damage-inducible protein DinB
VPDPTIVAARELLETSLHDVRLAIEGMSAEALNQRPAGEDTNAIVVLVTHAMFSTRSWLSLAMGVELPPRDRPAEFRATAEDADDLLAWSDAMAAECRALLADGSSYDPKKTGVAPWSTGPAAAEPVTAAWALLHAIVHLREHVAQALLTRQLVEPRA